MEGVEYGYMDTVEDLKRKVQHLEYDEIKTLKEDVSNIKIELAKNNILTQQSIDASNKTSETMDAVKLAMFEISESVRNSNRISTELTESVKDLNTRFDTMEEKIDVRFEDTDKRITEVDTKTKLDWAKCFTNGGWKKGLEWFIILAIIAYEILGRVGV